MIRVVLTVLVAVALLAAATPALEDARATTTAERIDAEADRVERAVGGLVAGSVSVADPSLAARTTVTVRVPSGFGAAPIDRVAIVETGASGETVGAEANVAEETSPGPDVALRYRIDGGPERTAPIGPGGTDATVSVDGGAIALRPGGESRLALRLVDDGGPTVRVTRVG
ncbi:hypothetical protein DJ82_05125 [Halorubrum sp. Ib24]|uniref:DUF7311 family protein n=1 Tax=unclassified Halorubrum TaxID=2642239 RepID=UPI000B990BD1|nr:MULTISPECIES: hypothetical protein [unclassified Halorubrum]OYR40470.1 hypothetical protein DJ75_15110 [Halorubrum sp. Eb13]OYR41440.1 hypothetical protein DJ82_05125 [Halorubrum sp. Ib24]OYR46873.1 hypothetical protein DJ81_02100 [Halorubrum sp. Hd13]OYR51563.1 hypothetical protein DJ74_03520 [Halorubrum sp. Ea8]OYR54751.1 hypothetical protein DJ73_04435 [Halorubrum sp. Ea1]